MTSRIIFNSVEAELMGAKFVELLEKCINFYSILSQVFRHLPVFRVWNVASTRPDLCGRAKGLAWLEGELQTLVISKADLSNGPKFADKQGNVVANLPALFTFMRWDFLR